MKIAVVGAGVSGLVVAHALQKKHEIVLFEGADRAGGHTNTVDVFEDERPVPIDTGFIVFNTRTYPNFIRWMAELGVAWVETEMSLSVRSDRRDFEYNARDLSTLFAQRRRVASPRFWSMVLDILRFFREGRELLDAGDEVPMLEWLQARRYSEAFIEDHLFPMLRAVWSANREVAETFPARFLVRFFDNHGFLQASDRPGWLSIPGGSRSYVRAVLAGFRGQRRFGAPVERIRREGEGALVKVRGQEAERFDHVVLACHSDQALALLESPSVLERETLGAIPYQRNEAVLHTDARLMPNLSKSWAAWNVHLDDEGVDGACVTYWMNRLQPLHAKKNYFVTLNRTGHIDPKTILRTEVYAHPVFTTRGIAAQARHAELIALDHVSYCGAYWRNGFHEDGVVSGLRVAERLAVSA